MSPGTPLRNRKPQLRKGRGVIMAARYNVRRAMEVSEYLGQIGTFPGVQLFEVDVYPSHYVVTVYVGENGRLIKVPHDYNENLRSVLNNTLRLITLVS